MAALLKPRFVCWESWLLQNIPTSAPSEHRKAIHLDGVFFGFSLHHLFMHLNYFRHHSALHGLERSNGWFLGFSCSLGLIEWVGGRGEGHYHCTAHMHAHRNCTMIAEIERGRGFESWNTQFTIDGVFQHSLPTTGNQFSHHTNGIWHSVLHPVMLAVGSRRGRRRRRRRRK